MKKEKILRKHERKKKEKDAKKTRSKRNNRVSVGV
jgi:hypothetical protein